MAHILVAGLGDLGSALAHGFVSDGHQVSAIRRQSIALNGVDLYPQDLAQDTVLLPPDQIDLLYIILTPSQRSVEGYQAAFLTAPTRLLDAIAAQQPLPPIVFVSSTAVYGQLSGWVNEHTAPKPDQFNGRILLAAEEELSLRSLTTVIRFSGIYGPGRERTLNSARELQEKLGADPSTATPTPVWSNRIHRDDCVALLRLVGQRWLDGEMVPPLIVGTDSQPTLNTVVLNWLATQQGFSLNLPEPDIAPGKRLRSDYISGEAITLQHSDFRSGYGALLRAVTENA